MKINRGKGTLGGVVNDRDLYYNLTAVSENLNKLLTEFRQNPKRFVNLSLFDFSSGKSTQDTYGIVIAESDYFTLFPNGSTFLSKFAFF